MKIAASLLAGKRNPIPTTSLETPETHNTLYLLHLPTTYSNSDNTTLSNIDVTIGKYTVVFFPR